MNGERYYTFKPADGVRFFALDSNYIDDRQLQWLEKELAASGSDWKICFFHHPLYSSGERHGSADVQRERLEPLFLKYGVDVVFSGHEHFYERIKPQKGIAYFTIGNSAKLRKGNIAKTTLTAKGWDQGYGFMLAEIVQDVLHFQVISDAGRTIDSGRIQRAPTTSRVQRDAPRSRPAGTFEPSSISGRDILSASPAFLSSCCHIGSSPHQGIRRRGRFEQRSHHPSLAGIDCRAGSACPASAAGR
jgi:hypothetical protein